MQILTRMDKVDVTKGLFPYDNNGKRELEETNASIVHLFSRP